MYTLGLRKVLSKSASAKSTLSVCAELLHIDSKEHFQGNKPEVPNYIEVDICIILKAIVSCPASTPFNPLAGNREV